MFMNKLVVLLGSYFLLNAGVMCADDLDNMMSDMFKTNLIDAEKSFEKPANFDASGRTIRWKNVFQTGMSCPVYETWRTKESGNSEQQQLHLEFRKAMMPGTVFAFASDSSPTEFTVKADNITPVTAAGIIVAPVNGPLKSMEFVSTRLTREILKNWGGYTNLKDRELSYFQFALSGIYAIKDKRINIAPMARAKVSGTSLRKGRENEESARNSAKGLNDLSTFNYWRSDITQENGFVSAELEFSTPVTVRELGLYFGFYLFGEMPKEVKVSAIDDKGLEFEVGAGNDFTSHAHTGKHFYLIRNRQPERKIKTLKFSCQAVKDVVTISEILVLAAPEDNSDLMPADAAGFGKVISIAAAGKSIASGVITDKNGNIVKNLPPIKSANGKFDFLWDGGDNSGKIVQPGDYYLRAVLRDTVHALYESTPYSPAATPWVTPGRKGGWLSDHRPASAILRHNDQLWVGSPLAESGDCIMQLDLDGNKQWGLRWLNLAGAEFLNEYSGKIYAISAGDWIGNKICVTEIDPKSKEFKTVFNILPPADISGNNKKSNCSGIVSGFAVNQDSIVIAYAKAGRIEFYDRTGKKFKEVKIDSPASPRFKDEHTLYLISGNRLIELDIDSGKSRPLVAEKVRGSSDFIVTDNRIIIADSADNNIKVFDASGKLLLTIGSATERKPGKYDPKTLVSPVAVALGKSNELWVAEKSDLPRRISVWDLNNGRFIREYTGPARYEAGSWTDPADKDIYYAEGMIFKRSGGKWHIDSIYSDFNSETYNLLLKKGDHIGDAPERPIRAEGNLFLIRDRHWANRKIWYGVMGKDNVLHPYSALGSYQELGARFKELPPQWNGKADDFTFLWVDRNRDGEMQWSELQFIKSTFSVLNWSSRMSDNLDYCFVLDKTQVYELPAVWKNGMPDYELSNMRKVVTIPGSQRITAMSPLPEDRLLINMDPLSCYDRKSGKLLWTYPNPLPSNSHDSKLPEPGEIQHTLNIEGCVNIPGFGWVFMLNGNKGLRYIFSLDGIYIGNLFNDMRMAPPLSVETVVARQDLGGYSLMDEAFNGSFARCSDGLVRFSGGKNHHSLYVVSGLESLKSAEAKLSFSQDEWKLAALAASKRKAENINTLIEPEPLIARLENPVDLINDKKALENLPEQRSGNGANNSFTAAMAIDEKYLYGIFRVKDTSPFSNNGSDWKMLFKSGDSVNIEMGNHKSKEVMPGDIRLLIAPFKGNYVAVIYRYRIASGPKDPLNFGSPVGNVEIDRVEQLRNAQIIVSSYNQGYLLKFRIPRTEIPALSGDAKHVYGDVGVIFSDAGGSINQYNLFHYGMLKGVTSDLPSEIRLTPEYWHQYNIK